MQDAKHVTYLDGDVTSLTALSIELTLQQSDDLLDDRLKHSLKVLFADLDEAIIIVVLRDIGFGHETVDLHVLLLSASLAKVSLVSFEFLHELAVLSTHILRQHGVSVTEGRFQPLDELPVDVGRTTLAT